MNVNYDELIILAGGAFAAVWGYGKYAEQKKILAIGIKVEGTVIELKSSATKDAIPIQIPVIKFETLNKEWITGKYSFGSSSLKYRIGDSVKVIYNPENAKQFLVENNQEKYVWPILMIVGIALIVGVVMYYFIMQFKGL